MSRVNYNVKEGRRKKMVWRNCIFPLIILMVCKCHTLISMVVCMGKDLCKVGMGMNLVKGFKTLTV